MKIDITKNILAGLVLTAAFLNMGVIRKDEDAVLKTQTDPISLKQKIEETKDGVKGAPTPTFRYYDREDFLTRSPMASAEEDIIPKSLSENELDKLSNVEESEFLDVSQDAELGKEKEIVHPEPVPASAEEDDWWVEDPS